ncbi:hypothetical protein [Planktothrix paucivesiculata]|uniref:Uncharacterized protein n=1 Tax=Planktothrix paucivesiculata PCC 9631 TaxID=671071 RepID=A0A7Z9BQ96_9CYAN|nr:hypothetical protein [Planktothrix paucivesiculata]VXD20277.1 hypothetical protein PL9631_500112 [Planktothrix paucivesiculata PCC 9631]
MSIDKISDQSYPGFQELKQYLLSCNLPSYAKGVGHSGEDMLWLDGSAEDSWAQAEFLNTALFRYYMSLCLSGLNVYDVLMQLLVLKYPNEMDFANKSGTYSCKVHVYPTLIVSNQAQMSQSAEWSYSCSPGKVYKWVTICY